MTVSVFVIALLPAMAEKLRPQRSLAVDPKLAERAALGYVRRQRRNHGAFDGRVCFPAGHPDRRADSGWQLWIERAPNDPAARHAAVERAQGKRLLSYMVEPGKELDSDTGTRGLLQELPHDSGRRVDRPNRRTRQPKRGRVIARLRVDEHLKLLHGAGRGQRAQGQGDAEADQVGCTRAHHRGTPAVLRTSIGARAAT